MKSLVLTPYCPLPANHGGKVEMMKHLELLRSLGECTIASSGIRPVGMGWDPVNRQEILKRGYGITLREETYPGVKLRHLVGIAYASLCKGLRLEKAFGHSNPYHRNAFNPDWWVELSKVADLAVINYSYWAWLPTRCPKIIILHDFLSNTMWGGCRKETEELRNAELVIVISKDEEKQLRQRGIDRILWSPPVVQPARFGMTKDVGIVGSANRFNREGLQWLNSSFPPKSLSVNMYGALAELTSWQCAQKVSSYNDQQKPYRECGIILIPTALGMGVQIKAVEALASGRAIVARRGAMRGIPPGEGAWIEVESPGEMWAQADKLSNDQSSRLALGEKARAYYNEHLDHEKIKQVLKDAYVRTAGTKTITRSSCAQP